MLPFYNNIFGMRNNQQDILISKTIIINMNNRTSQKSPLRYTIPEDTIKPKEEH